MSKLGEDLIEGMTEAVAHAKRFFSETVRARAQRDPAFRQALRDEGFDLPSDAPDAGEATERKPKGK